MTQHEHRSSKIHVSGCGRTEIWMLLFSQWNKPQGYPPAGSETRKVLNWWVEQGQNQQPLRDFPLGCQLVLRHWNTLSNCNQLSTRPQEQRMPNTSRESQCTTASALLIRTCTSRQKQEWGYLGESVSENPPKLHCPSVPSLDVCKSFKKISRIFCRGDLKLTKIYGIYILLL